MVMFILYNIMCGLYFKIYPDCLPLHPAPLDVEGNGTSFLQLIHTEARVTSTEQIGKRLPRTSKEEEPWQV